MRLLHFRKVPMVFVNEALTKDASAYDRVWMNTLMNPHLEPMFIKSSIKNTDWLGQCNG